MSSKLSSRFRRTATRDQPGSLAPTVASLRERKNSTRPTDALLVVLTSMRCRCPVVSGLVTSY